MRITRLVSLTLALTAVISLVACGQPERTPIKQSTSTSKNRPAHPKKNKEPTTKTTSSKTSKKVTSKKVSNEQQMNFAQIQRGNYQSLAGQWTMVANGVNKHDETGIHYESGGSGQLQVSTNQLTDGQMKLSGQTLTDNDGQHALTFKLTKEHALLATLTEDASINWTITFYPKGTSDDFLKTVGLAHNSQSLISVWTSNNSYTEIFAQVPANQPTANQ
ncbi:hypothetical protein AZI11_06760 [Levilactobacillus brevis]|uniref:DUF6287 domain-containing protein n=1 Tax=Levilactobacillus brevis TaxID=1580 RepID=UPI000A20AD26|nr:DUF6287 domain-containing protein [Levilactobacillus brevis]ARN92617.1 hypothetical protein AZI11_06760 [Levilactobacillus brevis]ARN95282.1 hypothetical protein AZI12_06810 [Levilactobacillus brevis]